MRGWRGDRITAPGPAPGAGRDGCAGSRGADAQGVPAYCCCRARATASRGSRRGRWWGPREHKPHNVREPVFSDPEPGTYGCTRHCRRVSRVTVTGPPSAQWEAGAPVPTASANGTLLLPQEQPAETWGPQVSTGRRRPAAAWPHRGFLPSQRAAAPVGTTRGDVLLPWSSNSLLGPLRWLGGWPFPVGDQCSLFAR